MSAIVCGKRRSFFEELPASSSSPVSKKLRCSSSTSPVRFSPFHQPSSVRAALFDKLREVFPRMDHQLLEQALEECGDDIDAAIKRLHELCLGSSEENSGSVNDGEAHIEQVPLEDSSASNLPINGAQWVELFVNEMMSATSVDDARARAAKLLEVLETSISSCASTAAAKNYQKENMALKAQIQMLMGENTILKRLVQKQHERQKECDDGIREAQELKQLISQYQDQVRNLEVRNYALTMHLKQAQQSSSMPGRFHPDIF